MTEKAPVEQKKDAKKNVKKGTKKDVKKDAVKENKEVVTPKETPGKSG